ncbi:phosphoglucosamine mutase [Synechococcus sp. CS-602]|uniref:phosphoglucosamine mutase n=1 Tax=Synechococcaceae TaxID=1890426 RepID=UPI0008FF2565|nr:MULTISPECIES: phosphoglucosamine mutase [Synechococcaceae]MCT4364954.1 phosphoglucosamine mutase [Candidatus Regnicoccus frigidus MAG-AL1]APD48208.1 phosphoglucosamine mutase [Synechococcus sp. SynAce01]MCT0203456.1 phosphoglucosamine mutase [Synechococcus sp. CS-603]MCT0204103.1 phosphoglucosamine mutase [Synechococcus sp. CS-602]MCT0246675.1 phosphoglucosamine mutase [Synechococcus sp. CS-601]
MTELASLPVGPPQGSSTPGFGTDGIRGRVGTLITPALALQVGYWCGHVLPAKGPVLIGMDSRTSSPMLAAALTAGLTAAGREVWNLGLCPTPAVPGSIRRLGAAGGLMVSASHNPPEDNGIKLFGSSGAKLSREVQQAIEAGLRGEPGATATNDRGEDGAYRCGPAHQRTDLLADYSTALLESVAGSRLQGCKIVLDLCWGSATACGVEVFRALGADLQVLHGEPDGRRINVGCGSTHLEPLRQAVLASGAQMGFAFDGDADRMLAVDGRGRVVDGDQILFLWGGALQEAAQLPDNRLVATVMSNLGFERAWQGRGGLLDRTAVGDQHVHAAMEASGAALGGEQSGHILSLQHGMSGDGLLTALQVASLIHGRGGSLAEWMESSFRPYPQRLVNVIVPALERRQHWQQSEPLRRAVEQAEASMAGSGRVLVRASGTEPLLRVMVEAAEQDQVDHWSSHLAALAQSELNPA